MFLHLLLEPTPKAGLTRSKANCVVKVPPFKGPLTLTKLPPSHEARDGLGKEGALLESGRREGGGGSMARAAGGGPFPVQLRVQGCPSLWTSLTRGQCPGALLCGLRRHDRQRSPLTLHERL